MLSILNAECPESYMHWILDVAACASCRPWFFGLAEQEPQPHKELRICVLRLQALFPKPVSWPFHFQCSSNRQAEMKILTELVLLLWPAQEQQPQVQPQAWPLHLPLVGVYAPYPAASHTPHSSFASWWLRRFWSADGKSDPGWFGAGTA